jgi:hypothetical protein
MGPAASSVSISVGESWSSTSSRSGCPSLSAASLGPLPFIHVVVQFIGTLATWVGCGGGVLGGAAAVDTTGGRHCSPSCLLLLLISRCGAAKEVGPRLGEALERGMDYIRILGELETEVLAALGGDSFALEEKA